MRKVIIQGKCLSLEYFYMLMTHISSVIQSCLTLWDPMNFSLPGSPVLHPLPGLAWTHVHWVGDAIQPSHPLFSPSPPAFNLSQHQGLFQWVSSSHQVAKVLECQLQHQAFQWIFRTYLKWEYDIVFIVMQFGLSSSTMLSVFLSLFTYLSMDQEEYDCKGNPFCSCCYYNIL